MPRFNAEYSTPTRAATGISDGARATFQNEEAEQLFTGLGLRSGGFQANANRVFITDDTGKLVAPPPYDSNDDHGMTAAARDGRLFIMGKDYRLRQVRLEGNENDGFAFAVSNLLQRKQRPGLSMAYYLRRFSAITDDFVRKIKIIWGDMMRDMAQNYNDWKRNMAKIWGGHNKEAEQTELKVEDGPLAPENETLQTEQTIGASKEEQIQQATESTMTREELLAQNPTQLTTQMFEKYMEALVQRRNEKPVNAALEKEDGKPTDYYEALAQELEGQIADDILRVAPKKESDPVGREQFLHDQKAVMACLSKDLRGFVETKVEPELVENHYAARAAGKNDVAVDAHKRELLTEALRFLDTGVHDYMKEVMEKNTATQQVMQQSQPNQVQQQPEPSKAAAPSMSVGHG